MATIDISIPKPVLTVEVDYEPQEIPPGKGEWNAKIMAGSVVLLERNYTSQADYTKPRGQWHPENYVHDKDDAEDRAINEFGRLLAAAIGVGA